MRMLWCNIQTHNRLVQSSFKHSGGGEDAYKVIGEDGGFSKLVMFAQKSRCIKDTVTFLPVIIMKL